MSKKIVTLDVREDIRRGQEPFSKIMQTASALKKNQSLLLIAPFEPMPLFAVLARQGFTHQTTPRQDGDWEVLFTRKPNAELLSAARFASQSLPQDEMCACGCGRKVLELDARGLVPPQPLAKILEALPQLTPSIEMKARTDRRPIHLYAHLDERGYVAHTHEEKDGSFVTYIHKCDDKLK